MTNRKNRGFTLTELLVSLAIVGLIGVAIAAGMPTAMKVYRQVTLSAEASTLSGSLTNLIADELRFSSSVTGGGDALRFDSMNYGPQVALTSENGRVLLGETALIPASAYTSDLFSDISLTYENHVFHVTLILYTLNGETTQTWVEQEFSVSPLNR